MSEPPARLRSLIEPLVEGVGLVLFDLEHTSGKLVVTVDSPAGVEGGPDMAAISDATRAISRALDADDPISGRYLLEVTSPGVERPLRTPHQFQWAIGKQVTVRLHPEPAAPAEAGDPSRPRERRTNGVLKAADETAITITTDTGDDVSIPYGDIQKARTVFDFDAELAAAKHNKPAPSGSSGPRKRAKAG